MAELTTLARPYAKAVFEFAVEKNSLDGWASMLGLAAAVVADEDMARVLSSPALTSEQQASLVIDVCGDRINDKARNLVNTLAENKRLPLLPQILAVFLELKAKKQKSMNVEVTTAFELDETIKQKLAQILGQKFECEVAVNSAIDKSLLGGVVIRTGDLVIDGSVRGRLAKLAEAMNS